MKCVYAGVVESRAPDACVLVRIAMPVEQSLHLAVVFLVSLRCNLECSYCNVDAGPHGFRAVLDLEIFEKWLEAFASL